MSKENKSNLNQDIYDLYDDYAHNKIERRMFMDKISMFAVGGLTVPAILKEIMPDYFTNAWTKADDPRLNTETITYNSIKGGGKIDGQLSRAAKAKGKMPGVIVVHENRGLNPYIEDTGRSAALHGFISLAPDALTPLGGYPGNDDEGRTMQKKRDRNEMLEDFIAAFEYLRKHPQCNGNVGVMGFCFGGWISNMMAVKVPKLKAAVPFYGGQPDDVDVPAINASLMLHFGELDKRVNAGWPAYETALKANDKEYESHVYKDANHGFHNFSTSRYDEPSAKLAWERTMSFLKSKLA